MKFSSALWPILFTSSAAWAGPPAFTHQGRLLDSSGIAVEGEVELTFRFVDAASGGRVVWSEVQRVELNHGYYAVVLGSDDQVNPIDDAALDQWPLFLEVQVGQGRPMSPRLEVTSVPYARHADVADSVVGGPVDASSVLVGGEEVIDGNGNWTGPTPPVSWDDLDSLPGDLADGDDDTLGSLGLSCVDGQVPAWDVSSVAWVCHDIEDRDLLSSLACGDGQVPLYDGVRSAWTCAIVSGSSALSESQVDVFVANNGYASLAALAVVATSGRYDDLSGVPLDLADGDDDTLASLSCLDGQRAVWDAVGGTWSCGGDRDTLASLGCSVGQLAQWNGAAWACAPDGKLTESEVDAYVANNGYVALSALAAVASSGRFADLSGVPAGLADGDDDLLATLSCLDAQGPSWDALAGAWSCAADRDTLAVLGCSVGQLAKWNGSAWACASDAGLTESEVDAYVANNGYAALTNLAAVATSGRFSDLSGVPSGLANGDDDTLGSLSCLDRQRPVWDAVGGIWSCSADRDTLGSLGCSVGQLAKWSGSAWACAADAKLTESEVDAYVANNGYAALAALATVATTGKFSDLSSIPAGLGDGDDDTLANLSCLDKQRPVWDGLGGVWSCSADRDTLGSLGCSVGQLAKWNGSAWACAPDGKLTESEVDAYVANNGYAALAALAAVATTGKFSDLSSIPAGLGDGDDDTLASLSCLDAQVPHWDEIGWQWYCADDATLTEAQVESMIFNEPVELPVGSTIGGLPLDGGGLGPCGVVATSRRTVTLDCGGVETKVARVPVLRQLLRYSAGVCAIDADGYLQCSSQTWSTSSEDRVLAATRSDADVCVVRTTGDVHCYSETGHSQPLAGNDFKDIAGPAYAVCGLHSSGAVECASGVAPSGTFTELFGEDWPCGRTTAGAVTCWRPSGTFASYTSPGPYVSAHVDSGLITCAQDATGATYCWNVSTPGSRIGVPGVFRTFSACSTSGTGTPTVYGCGVLTTGGIRCIRNTGNTDYPGSYTDVACPLTGNRVIGLTSDGELFAPGEDAFGL